ncbi:HAD-IA family hydrolase [Patescibacteria group bacterium]
MKMKNIIFDLGGVILTHEINLMPNIISAMFQISHEEASDFWETKKHQMLVGNLSSENFIRYVKTNLKSDIPIHQLICSWNELYIQKAENIDWGLLNIIDRLRDKYKLYLLTDTIDTHDDYNKNRGIYDKFDQVFKSHIEGVSKITDSAFLKVLRKIKAKPDECIFIDDLRDNIIRARKIGMISILYKSRIDLQKKLVQLKVISE